MGRKTGGEGRPLSEDVLQDKGDMQRTVWPDVGRDLRLAVRRQSANIRLSVLRAFDQRPSRLGQNGP